jgi:hypothetical protein
MTRNLEKRMLLAVVLLTGVANARSGGPPGPSNAVHTNPVAVKPNNPGGGCNVGGRGGVNPCIHQQPTKGTSKPINCQAGGEGCQRQH